MPAGGAAPLLLFVHIPKAAGSSLGDVIHRQYPPGTIFQLHGRTWQDSVRDFLALPEEERRRYRVVAGHMDFGLHEHLPVETAYLTMVRDPVERVISNYHYVLREPGHFLHDEVVGRGLDLRAYAESRLAPQLENGQTRILAACNDLALRCSEIDLERAKRNLEERFVAVGVSERFDESILLFARALGWGRPLYRRANVTEGRPRRDAFDAETIDAIVERNLLDLELHRWCTERLDREIGELGDAFTRELRAFERANRLFGVASRARRRLRAAR